MPTTTLHPWSCSLEDVPPRPYAAPSGCGRGAEKVWTTGGGCMHVCTSMGQRVESRERCATVSTGQPPRPRFGLHRDASTVQKSTQPLPILLGQLDLTCSQLILAAFGDPSLASLEISATPRHRDTPPCSSPLSGRPLRANAACCGISLRSMVSSSSAWRSRRTRWPGRSEEGELSKPR
jgi:hypothetical protein